jgi:putative DNA primase/helicase
LKEYKIEKAGMFIGKGRNGKSKTLELMKKFIGPVNCSSLPLSMMKTESFCISELFGKMANLSGDLSNTDLKETGIIKMLIGRDTIQAKRKFLRDLNFVNYAKLLFAANELPKVYDMSDGFWTKWVLLEFPYKFIPKEEYDKLNEKDKTGLKIMNPDIIQSLTTEEELSGLLNMALDGLDRLLKQEDFSYTKGTQEVKELWIRQSDSFMSFCLDCIESSPNENITKRELRKYYHKYCQKHKVRGASDMGIKATLQSMFGADEGQKTIVIDIENKIKDIERVWEGIRFKESFEEKL